MHDYHEQLPGYSPGQILHDGCGECEERGKRADHGLSSLDVWSFERAWNRAAAWELVGVADLSECERGLLLTLASVQRQLQQRGIPFGVPPGSTFLPVSS